MLVTKQKGIYCEFPKVKNETLLCKKFDRKFLLFNNITKQIDCYNHITLKIVNFQREDYENMVSVSSMYPIKNKKSVLHAFK